MDKPHLGETLDYPGWPKRYQLGETKMFVEGCLVETGEPVRLELEGTRIGRVRPASPGVDLWLSPGLIDIQVNGYAGHDLNGPDVEPEVVARLVRSLWRVGVTAACATVITQSEARICRSLRAIADACEADPLIARSIPCIHVEGPHISPEDGPRGAHPLEHVRPPSLAEYRRWQKAAKGRIGIVTLAPEHPGSCEYIASLAAEGVVVAIGHTAADGDQIQAAVNAGARLSTHLGNGSHARIQRHPNYIWDQLAEDRLWASLILDGHHLPPSVIKAMLRAKGLDRAILISDAVAVAGSPPGVYETATAGKVELLSSGRLSLHGTPYLAGSASPLVEGIANAVRHAGVTLAEAVRLATANPAQLLRLDGPEGRGSLRAGGAADLTAIRVDATTHDLTIELTVVGGEVVYRRGT